MVAWTTSRIPRDVDPARVRRPRDNGAPAPFPLRTRPGSDFWRSFLGSWVVVGLVAMVVTLVALAVTDRRATDRAVTAERASATSR
jgi:hypothetical protein